MTKRRILVIVRRPPYVGSLAYESLEAVLVAGVFEQEVSMVFIDDGVLQLLRHQNAELLGARNVGHGLRALSTYDVNRLYADEASLSERGLSLADLEVDVASVSTASIRALIPLHDVVVTA